MVVLTSPPDGLSSYYLDRSVSNFEIAHIGSASSPDAFGLTINPDVGSDGAMVTLEAANVEEAIETGVSNVTFATAKLAGAAPSEAQLTVNLQQFGLDDGNALQPTTRASVMTVTTEDTAADTDTTGTRTVVAGAATTATANTTGETGTTAADIIVTAVPLLALLDLITVGRLAAIALTRRPYTRLPRTTIENHWLTSTNVATQQSDYRRPVC